VAITEQDIENLYRTWLIERASMLKRPARFPKDYKKNKRLWTVFTKLAAMLEGSPVDPRAYMRACLYGIQNCQPAHLISQKGIDAFEKYHNLQVKEEESPIQNIQKSLDWVLEFCRNEKISFHSYLFYEKGKSRVAVIHLDIGNLSPYLLLVMPAYEKFVQSLDGEDKDIVLERVAKAFYVISKDPDKYLKIQEKLMLLP